MPTDVMTRPRLLVVESDAKHLRTLTRTLKAIVGSVDARETLDNLPGEDEFELVVANYDVMADDTRKALLERFGGKKTKTNLLFFSEGKCKEDFVDLFGGHYLTNLVAKNNAEVDPEELIVTTRKIVNRDIFGLEKYFIWGVEPRSIRITKSTEKAAVVTAAEEYAKNLGVNARFVSHFCSVADEFVTNAVYNAPRDKDGKHRFAHISRTEEVELSAGEDVEVKFCCDGRRLGISTADPFGSLHLERLLDYLAKCLRKGSDQVDEKEGGAGLGFYYIFDSLSHFVVNIAPGKRTEMIGIIDIRGTYRDFSARHKSFNVFTAGLD
jgi:hypothetical protein